MVKVRIIIILIFLSLLFSTTSWGETEYDFHKTRWGMTKKEVKASESERLLKEMKFDEKEVVSYGFDEVIIYVGKTTSIKRSNSLFVSE